MLCRVTQRCQPQTIARRGLRTVSATPPRSFPLIASAETTPSTLRRPLGRNTEQSSYSESSRRFASTISSGSPPTSATQPTCSTCPNTPSQPNVYSFFESATSTWQYVVTDPTTKKAVIVDRSIDDWFDLFTGVDNPLANERAFGDRSVTWKENFKGWWALWRGIRA